ncbi:MAG: hypothetical protein JXR25_02875 [Pontiellaceae bacterium]|nr:hypothetical protein [Pontiellaceae bacterium]MBN2783747.1 hypothetical protein [Pontiellaceae bacterium]
MEHENKRKSGVGHRKFNALVRFLISINLLVLACYWLGKSESVFAYSDWRGLVSDNLSILIVMGSVISLAYMSLKPNVTCDLRLHGKENHEES